MKKVTPEPKPAPKNDLERRLVANEKAAAEKKAARGATAKPAHSVYPHLD